MAKPTQHCFLRALVFLGAILRCSFSASAVENAFTVGDGTPDGCTETALRDALSLASANGGGTIRFSCGEDPVTIVLTEIQEVRASDEGGAVMLDLPDKTTIDGGGMITLAAEQPNGGPHMSVRSSRPR